MNIHEHFNDLALNTKSLETLKTAYNTAEIIFYNFSQDTDFVQQDTNFQKNTQNRLWFVLTTIRIFNSIQTINCFSY